MLKMHSSPWLGESSGNGRERVVAVGGRNESAGGVKSFGRVEKCATGGGKWRERRNVAEDWLNFNGSMTCRALHSPPRFSLCLAHPEHPKWSRDWLGAPDSVLGRTGRKGRLGRATGAKKNVQHAPKPFGGRFGGVTGDALRFSP
jgi:hypothetical protein